MLMADKTSFLLFSFLALGLVSSVTPIAAVPESTALLLVGLGLGLLLVSRLRHRRGQLC
jgi:hypothetical protein